MRVLVTGASGFIGRPLVAALMAQGHQAIALVRRPLESRHGEDIRISAPIETLTAQDWAALLAGVDAVIHAAGIAHRTEAKGDAPYRRVNTEATVRLAEASAAAGVARFVFLSSINAQIGSWSPDIVTETLPAMPADAYGRSKFAAEILVRQILPGATILRPVLVVGPEPKGNLARLLRIAAGGRPLPFASFDAPRSLVSLPNLTDAIILGLTRDRLAGRSFVVADPDPVTLAEMITILRQGMDLPRRLFPFPRPLFGRLMRLAGRGAVFDRVGRPLIVDAGLLTRAGWQPATTTRATLLAMAEAYRRGGTPGSPR